MEGTSLWRCRECLQGYSGVGQASNPYAPLGKLVCWRCYNNAKIGADPGANRADRRRAAKQMDRAARKAHFGNGGRA